MTWLVKALVSPVGRIVRIGAGASLVAWGLFGVAGAVGIVIAAIGLVPLLAGTLDRCLFAPLFGYFFSGPRTRAAF